MAGITLTVEHSDGSKQTLTHDLPGNLDTLDDIDEAVEQFKRVALPQVEQTLLAQSQERAVAQEKKTLAHP